MIITSTQQSNPVYASAAVDDTFAEVLQGLKQEQKVLPSKWFYDQCGSRLFDQICKLAEYYPTRTEIAIMQQNIREIVAGIGSNSLLIEYGSGSSRKTRLLLDHILDLAAYVPVDISKTHLYNTAENLNQIYPNLMIFPVYADFTRPFALPLMGESFSQKLAYFPGSTIGNFYPQQAVDFMRNIAALVGSGGGLLIGIDLQKNPDVLNLAYNDANGVTAAFNRNMLTHINRKLQADFVIDEFEHLAFYNQESQRIEMHLVSKKEQAVTLNGEYIFFHPGEQILTEVSYKYTIEGFAELAIQAGFEVQNVWQDSNDFFSIQHLVVR